MSKKLPLKAEFGGVLLEHEINIQFDLEFFPFNNGILYAIHMKFILEINFGD